MKTQERAAVERTHVTAEIQRHPRHYRVVSGQIKLLYVRWGEERTSTAQNPSQSGKFQCNAGG
jgi:hypothetical protein